MSFGTFPKFHHFLNLKAPIMDWAGPSSIELFYLVEFIFFPYKSNVSISLTISEKNTGKKIFSIIISYYININYLMI